MGKNGVIRIDLPCLQAIELGWCALEGRDTDVTCSLQMRSMAKWIEAMQIVDLPELLSIASREFSFYNTRIVKLESGLRYQTIDCRCVQSSKCQAASSVYESSNKSS